MKDNLTGRIRPGINHTIMLYKIFLHFLHSFLTRFFKKLINICARLLCPLFRVFDKLPQKQFAFFRASTVRSGG